MDSPQSNRRKIQINAFFDENNQIIFCCNKCEMEFSDNDSFKKHYFQEFCTEMSSLDENCMDTIFKYLPPNDLAAMSLTCKRYKTSAERYFYWNQRIDPVALNSSKTDVWFEYESDDTYAYQLHFAPLIRSIYWLIKDFTKENCESFKKKCAKELECLILNFRELSMDESNSEIIKEQLEHLKYLCLHNTRAVDLHQVLLKHCKNLESLTVSVNSLIGSLDYGATWLNQSYPKLKLLIFMTYASAEIDLTNFLSLNPNIDIICNYVPMIKSICQSETKLRSVGFVFDLYDDFAEDAQLIERWSRRKNFENFHVAISGSHDEYGLIEKAIGFQNITELHCRLVAEQIVNIGIAKPHIQKLYITYNEQSESFFDGLENMFPNICELQVFSCFDLIELECLELIVSRFSKLKQLTMLCALKIVEEDIVALNRARFDLKDACHLQINIYGKRYLINIYGYRYLIQPHSFKSEKVSVHIMDYEERRVSSHTFRGFVDDL